MLSIDHEITVCTYDIDFANHVSNIAYLRWLEDMRLRLFEKYFPLKMFLDEGKTPIISSTTIHYRRPIKLFDVPRGHMWISELGNATFSIEARLHVGEQLTTEAKHTGVFIELATGRPIRLPKIIVEKYNASRS